ncbi:MAG: peptidyl-prolyl cis-trans isomerase [Eubacteriales bacterium]|nr:peptidyl-prolyl cis-trans isomerase [Eubacteriales bacterium]
MREIAKRTAVAALAGVMAAGMLTGCGDKKLDGTKTVATVDGTEIPMGVVSLAARQQQAQTDAMYKSLMGGAAAGIWDQEVDEESGETYGDQAVKQVLEQIELMYILKEKAGDYNVEVTEEDQTAIADAAAAFMAANNEEALEALAVTEDQVKTLLELETYRERVHDAIVAEANVEITDEEAQQSAFTYVSVSTSGEELTEEDIAKKKEQAQEILDKVKEDPSADMSETAKEVDESYTALEGTFTTNESEDEDASSSAYPEQVITALRELKEGEVSPELIETDTSYYIVRLDKELDEDATESKKASLKSTKENEFYTETTDKWMDEADIKVEDKVLKTLKITDTHTFTLAAPESTEETPQEETTAGTEDAAEEDAENADAENEGGDTDGADTEEDTAENTDDNTSDNTGADAEDNSTTENTDDAE